MAAAKPGARDAGALSIGLSIDLPFEEHENQWIDLPLNFHYFFTRQGHVSSATRWRSWRSRRVRATMDELFECLTLIQTRKISYYPILLVGRDYWTPLVDWLRDKVLAEGKISARTGAVPDRRRAGRGRRRRPGAAVQQPAAHRGEDQGTSANPDAAADAQTLVETGERRSAGVDLGAPRSPRQAARRRTLAARGSRQARPRVEHRSPNRDGGEPRRPGLPRREVELDRSHELGDVACVHLPEAVPCATARRNLRRARSRHHESVDGADRSCPGSST